MIYSNALASSTSSFNTSLSYSQVLVIEIKPLICLHYTFKKTMYNLRMKKYRENLKNFIENIKNREIIENEVAIGELSQPIIEKLLEYNIIVETTKIYLSVKAYNHQLRAFKQKKGKSIPVDLVKEFYHTLNSPYKVFLDVQNIDRVILIYVDREQNFLFKIVIQPNYKTKKGLLNYILTSGVIKTTDLNSRYYEEIDIEPMVGT